MMWVVGRGRSSRRKTWLGALPAEFGVYFTPLMVADLWILCTFCFSLAEAQRMTSVYAKMEYGVKRLLWLGG